MKETILNLRKLQQIAKKHGAYFVSRQTCFAHQKTYDEPLRLANPPITVFRFYSLETNKKLNNVEGVDWGGWFTFNELVDFLTAAEEGRLNDPKYKY